MIAQVTYQSKIDAASEHTNFTQTEFFEASTLPDRPAIVKKLLEMGVDFADINRDGLDDIFVADMMMREHGLRQRLLGSPHPPVAPGESPRKGARRDPPIPAFVRPAPAKAINSGTRHRARSAPGPRYPGPPASAGR